MPTPVGCLLHLFPLDGARGLVGKVIEYRAHPRDRRQTGRQQNPAAPVPCAPPVPACRPLSELAAVPPSPARHLNQGESAPPETARPFIRTRFHRTGGAPTRRTRRF